MLAGVPQGSVLGPILWNITYDEVLTGICEKDCRTIGYADDTLVLSEADKINEAVARANIQTGLILNKIKRLGLTIAAQKTEVLYFMGKQRMVRTPVIDVEGTQVMAGKRMKYLGVILDDRMSFSPHLEYIENKVGTVTRTLHRIIPNLRGPGEGRRRLYANIIFSVALYAAPIWGGGCNARTQE